MGTLWNRSGSIERDDNDARAVGAKAYFYVGGTGSEPTPVYSDASESTVRTQPVVADAHGRWPAVFIPFQASYDEKLTTSGGTQFWFLQNIPNPDPVEASEDSVDDNQLLQTGDTVFNFIAGTRTSFVRCNGRTIGNAASGATERANPDTSDLFTYLYNGLANGQAAVSGGRGASAAADYAANKTIALPDLRGALPLGLDDMGNSAASLLGSVTFGHGNATTPGSLGGANTHTITEAQLPNHTHTFSATSGTESADHTHAISITSGTESADHTHAGTTGDDSPDHTHAPSTGGQFAVIGVAGATWLPNTSGPNSTIANTGGASARHQHAFTTGGKSATHTHLVSGTSAGKSATHTHSVSGTTGTGSGSGTAHNIVSRALLGTWYMKL